MALDFGIILPNFGLLWSAYDDIICGIILTEYDIKYDSNFHYSVKSQYIIRSSHNYYVLTTISTIFSVNSAKIDSNFYHILTTI